VNGTVASTGNIATEGDVVATGDVVADGISLDGHVHGDVMNGAGDTGPPVMLA
jgi:cytoskeletal protein CcmA (bactofilin family)